MSNTSERAQTPPQGHLTQEIAGIIAGMMTRYKVSQTEMAGPVGVAQSHLSKMLRGLRPINIDQLEIMCAVLGVEVTKIVDEAVSEVNNKGLWPEVRALVLEGIRQTD